LKLAAIDIGSNAVRMQITNVIVFRGKITFKKLEYMRFPLRLGQDVFEIGEIGPQLKEKFISLLQAFKIWIDLYEVDDVMACATSAMRESANGEMVRDEIKDRLGLDIEIIGGQTEADIINKAIFKNLDFKTYLHIDVGGGSTELNLYVGHEKIAAESFKMGSVRRIKSGDEPLIWGEMENWVKDHIHKDYQPVISIGTGGNINKIYDLSGKKRMRDNTLSINEVMHVREVISTMTPEERINVLMLNPDRADVILPASEIYLQVMHFAKSKKILVPDVGLKDGMIQMMFERNQHLLPQ
jgi:exopolyphosphatase / guanosine-5'-triphosphate,3'-diphosphate pyrophosphatase